MKFNVDHYFHAGRTHLMAGKPCQDFALSSRLIEGVSAVVSDGCSTGRYTDMGARVYAFATQFAIASHQFMFRGDSKKITEQIEGEMIKRANFVRSDLNLEKSDLLATLLYAYLTPLGGLVRIMGDGVVAMKYRDGRIIMRRYDWAGNAPFYPSYDEGDSVLYIQNIHGGEAEKAHMSVTSAHYDGSRFGEEHVYSVPFHEGKYGVTFPIDKSELSSDLEFVALFSDGIGQIDNVDWKSAVINFLNFKSLAGEFAKRRMIRGIKDCELVGKGPLDDISFAVIRILPLELTEE